MTKQEFRRVEAWLYSIPRLKIAVENLKLELERLDTKAASPPTWVSNPNAPAKGGNNLDSRQEKWLEFLDEYPLRRQEILQKIQEREQQLAGFEKVLDMLRNENGQYAQLVKAKYIEKVKPDSVIYNKLLVVSERTFYRMRIYVVKTFYECLPAQFLKWQKDGRNVAEKTV